MKNYKKPLCMVKAQPMETINACSNWRDDEDNDCDFKGNGKPGCGKPNHKKHNPYCRP